MQGRSIGSKRFKVGEAAPQPTRASIYQEENTPLDWMAPHDLRAQLAVPKRHATPHPRALRHGLIASQLGLPMLARGEPVQAPEAWELPADDSAWPRQARAAYSGDAEHAGLDWPNTEQTHRYDEWELQKELVTYGRAYPGDEPGYDEHPRLDFQLPPVAAGYEPEPDQRHELDYAQAAYAPAEHREHASSPGSYPYAHMARNRTQPSAARWHSQQPILRVQAASAPAQPQPASFAPRAHTGSTHARAQTHPGAAAPEPRTATQTNFAPHASATRTQGGGAALEPHTKTQASFARAHTGVAGQARAAQPWSGTRAPKQAVRRYSDDEPVVYPHRRSWLKRTLLLLALAGGGYAGHHHYYYQRAPVPMPAPPAPPTAAAPVPPEPPAAPIEPTETTTPSPTQAPTAPESAKERRLAARAAVFAERRERRAARRARDEDSAGDEREDSPKRSRAHARASHERAAISEPSSYASPGDQSNDYERDHSATRAATTAHDDYVSDRHAAAQSGVLRINTLPWSQVHIDGQLVGHTPQMNLLLPAGKHRVTLVNHEMQLSKSLTVQITAGATTTHTINLAD